MLQLDPLASSIFSLLIIISLLLNFVILGSHWLQNYVYAFTAESWIISALSAGIGYYAKSPELYLIAALTMLFRGIILPWLITRMVNRLEIKRELHSLLPPSSSLILCTLLVVFAFLVSTHLAELMGLTDHIILLAIIAMLAINLIGFLLLSIRDQAISKVLALLVLENGIFLGSIFLIPGMPLLIELVILFDLLIVIISFSILIRFLQSHVGSTSTQELKRLVG